MATERQHIITHSVEETYTLGKHIGAHLQNSLIIALKGDLGSGKTSFVQGLAAGLDISKDQYITSPTFTIINEYFGRLRLFHIDLYRVQDSWELEDLGFDDILRGDGIIAIEWSERLPEKYLSEYLEIHLIIVDDTQRKISFFPYGLETINLIRNLVIEKI